MKAHFAQATDGTFLESFRVANTKFGLAAQARASMGGSAVLAPRVIVLLGLLYVGIALYFGIKLEYETSSFDFKEVSTADWPVELGSCASASNPPMEGTGHIENLHQCQQECKRRGHSCAAFSIMDSTGECSVSLAQARGLYSPLYPPIPPCGSPRTPPDPRRLSTCHETMTGGGG